MLSSLSVGKLLNSASLLGASSFVCTLPAYTGAAPLCEVLDIKTIRYALWYMRLAYQVMKFSYTFYMRVYLPLFLGYIRAKEKLGLRR